MAEQTTPQPQLDINVLIGRFQAEIAQLSARAIMAEAEVLQLRQQNEFQRQVIENAQREQEPQPA
jgi:cell division protein FtsB